MNANTTHQNPSDYVVIEETIEQYYARCNALREKLPIDHPDRYTTLPPDLDGDVIGGQVVYFGREYK